MQYCFSSQPIQGHLAIWAQETRLLQNSSQLKVSPRRCLTDLCLFPTSKEAIFNTELLLKQCRAEVSWNGGWRRAKLWAVLLSTLWGDASAAYGRSSTASQTDKSIWVLAQLELDASETTATWIAEAMLSFCVWIWWTYWPSKKATVLKSRQPRRCRCLLAGQFSHCYLPTARLLSSNGWGKGTRLRVWEGAALVK